MGGLWGRRRRERRGFDNIYILCCGEIGWFRYQSSPSSGVFLGFGSVVVLLVSLKKTP